MKKRVKKVQYSYRKHGLGDGLTKFKNHPPNPNILVPHPNRAFLGNLSSHSILTQIKMFNIEIVANFILYNLYVEKQLNST